jgi:hypothetical protein
LKSKDILNYCLEKFEGTVLVNSWGEKGVFYNPDNTLKRGVYTVTVKEKDGDNDKSSNLDRKGVFRVNLGLRKSTFEELFGFIPKRPPAGGIVEIDYNFQRSIRLCLTQFTLGWDGFVY